MPETPIALPEPGPAPTTQPVPVYGISEWQCWYGHYDIADSDPEQVVDDCIDAHLALGIDHLVWNAGRSTVDYWSDLPGHKRQFMDLPADASDTERMIKRVMETLCPLRAALERCRTEGVPLLARLAMNRHYGIERQPHITSHFAAQHPEYQERDRAGRRVSSKLCYAIPEVREERLAILLELQRIGVDGLLLGFCRQPPILMYHEALVEPFREETGVDPRGIDSADPDDFREWFQFRADVLTGFMRSLREGVRKQEAELGRRCPIVARIPDASEWLLLAYGIDLRTWLAEDLIDATMISPFPLTREDPARHFEEHVRWAHEHGKPCIGALGSLGLFTHPGMNRIHDHGDFRPRPAWQIMAQQYEVGVDGMSIYQSETLARLPELAELLAAAGDPATVAEMACTAPGPDRDDLTIEGLDWHARVEPRHGIGTSVDAPAAL
jgi:hypothetical protein